MLPTIQIQTGKGAADAAIIWLHGLGADGHDFEPLAGQLDLGDMAVRFVLPHAPVMPVTVNGGYLMPAWYDIRESAIDTEVDYEGIDRAAEAVFRLVEREMMRGITPQRVIVAGFSQGAVVALRCGMTHRKSVGGVIALSGYLPFSIPAADGDAPSIFVAHGVHDGVVPVELGDRAQRQLREAGYSVEWKTWPIEHSVCAEEITAIGCWIRSLWL